MVTVAKRRTQITDWARSINPGRHMLPSRQIRPTNPRNVALILFVFSTKGHRHAA